MDVINDLPGLMLLLGVLTGAMFVVAAVAGGG